MTRTPIGVHKCLYIDLSIIEKKFECFTKETPNGAYNTILSKNK